MISSIISLLSKNRNLNIVCNERIRKEIEPDILNVNIHEVNDPRSAIFFAFGLINTKSTKPILVIDSKDEPDVVTGLTECWFQKKSLFVFVMNGKNEIFNKNILRNCIDSYHDVNDLNAYPVRCKSFG